MNGDNKNEENLMNATLTSRKNIRVPTSLCTLGATNSFEGDSTPRHLAVNVGIEQTGLTGKCSTAVDR